ncbi:MAG: hypothetical protein PUA55_01035 [Mycoplasma sp.]|nr:hypothetical protein [Mycoplasma sp.]
MDKSKITKSLAVFASVLLIIIIGVASFAYFGTFNVNLNNNVAVNINAVSPGDATFISNATQLNLQVPAANMSFTVANNTVAAKEDTAFLDVTLTGSSNLLTTCTYDIVYEYDTGSNVYGQGTTTKTGDATKEITIEVNGMNGNNHFAIETNFDHANIQSYYDNTNKYYKLVEGATIKSLGSTQSVRWKITGRYYNLEASQSQLDGKNFTGKIYAISKGCTSEDGSSVKKGYETILANNGGTASMTTLTSTDFANVTTASDKGMYKAEDDLGMSYYFRGAVDNNWVKYGKYTKDMYNCNNGTISATDTGNSCTKIASSGDDIYWRIIRINGDNSIRMIYSGVTPPTESTKVIKTTDTSLRKSSFNQNYDSAEYVGYMYTIGEQHGTSQSSDIKTYLEDWYANYTDLNKTGTKITDQIYCNDRTVSTDSSGTAGEISSWASTGTIYYYGTYLRLYGDSSNPSPSLKCTNANDKFTTTIAKGNGKLSYPVGLITADEVNMAGADNQGSINSSYYLYTGDYYWAGSPDVFNEGNLANEFSVSDDGYLHRGGVNNDSRVRGVVSLSSKAKLSGSGTYNDVYTVS